MTVHTKESLHKLTVPQIKQLVRDHNLHYTIRGYSKMKKADLVDAFLEKQVVKPKKKSTAKPKLGKADKAFGLGQPLFKEGLVPGATKQFEAKYGKRHTDKQKLAANALGIIEAQQKAQNLGRGRRKKATPKHLKYFDVSKPKKGKKN
eukprot:m.355229 g.355229  ORF g.355229 m.355229 type:complete len:148 (-) comp16597_c1_seq26:261-704(-)